jgi:hypothetical protein
MTLFNDVKALLLFLAVFSIVLLHEVLIFIPRAVFYREIFYKFVPAKTSSKLGIENKQII